MARDIETARDRWLELTDKSFSDRSVMILWATNETNVITEPGSGVPVLFRGRYFIATASHVLEPPKGYPNGCYGPLLWFRQLPRAGTSSSDVILEDSVRLIRRIERQTQERVAEDGSSLPWPDVGLIELSDPGPLLAAGMVFTELPRLAVDAPDDRYAFWALHGWPVGLIKSLSELDPKGWAMTAMRADLRPPILMTEMHLQFEYELEVNRRSVIRSFDPRLRGLTPEEIVPASLRIPSVDEFKGMSGGPLWAAEDFSRPIVSPESFRLAGLQSSIDARTTPPRLRVTRIAEWIRFADGLYPEASSGPSEVM